MLKKKRGRRRKCDSVNVEANTSVRFSNNKVPVNGGQTILFGGMDIVYSKTEPEFILETINGGGNITGGNNNNIKGKAARSNSFLNEPDLSLCDIDIPDRIVVKHNRKPRKRIIEDSDRIYKVLIGWPETTDLLCWWCCSSFEGSPKCIPTNYDELKDSFSVTGNFCSWNCSKAFTIYERPKQISNLTRLIQHIHGFIPTIVAAPPRFILKSFGGTMELEEFRKNESLFEINKPNIVLDEKLFYIKTT